MAGGSKRDREKNGAHSDNEKLTKQQKIQQKLEERLRERQEQQEMKRDQDFVRSVEAMALLADTNEQQEEAAQSSSDVARQIPKDSNNNNNLTTNQPWEATSTRRKKRLENPRIQPTNQPTQTRTTYAGAAKPPTKVYVPPNTLQGDITLVKDDVNHQKIYKEMARQFPAQAKKILGIQTRLMPNGKCRMEISCADMGTCRTIMVKGVDLGTMHVIMSPLGTNELTVSIFGLPAMMPKEFIREHLSAYGTVGEIKQESYIHENGHETLGDKRMARVAFDKPSAPLLPLHDQIAGHSCKNIYNGVDQNWAKIKEERRKAKEEETLKRKAEGRKIQQLKMALEAERATMTLTENSREVVSFMHPGLEEGDEAADSLPEAPDNVEPDLDDQLLQKREEWKKEAPIIADLIDTGNARWGRDLQPREDCTTEDMSWIHVATLAAKGEREDVDNLDVQLSSQQAAGICLLLQFGDKSRYQTNSGYTEDELIRWEEMSGDWRRGCSLISRLDEIDRFLKEANLVFQRRIRDET